jgi:hypothetical protein
MNIRKRRSLHCFVAALVLVVAWSPARATVVIESYTFARPLDAAAILAPVYAGLHARGIHAHPEQVLSEIRGALPMPVNDNFDLDASDVMRRIDLGMSRARYGKHEEAIHLFEKALEDFQSNPAMTTSLVDGRSWITKALAGLARAHYEKGNLKEAAEVIAEHVRSFPEFPIDRGTYGPKLAELYIKTRSALDAQPHGRLIVVIVDRTDASIFVNEHKRGIAGLLDTARPPGEYRIMIRVGGLARRYRVQIHPDEDSLLQIHWQTDTAFVVSREWLGFASPTGPRTELLMFVYRIVTQIKVHGVIVLGIVRRGGHRYITARKHSAVTAEYAGGASIELGEREDAKIKALVSFLVDGERSSDLLPLVYEPDPIVPRSIAPARWPIWASAATAAGAFAAGGYLLFADGSCRDDACVETRHTASWGWAAVGVGAAAIAVGASWYFHARPKSGAAAPAVGLEPRSSGGLLTLSGRF